MKEIVARAVKSKIITSKSNLLEVIVATLKKSDLKRGDILVITSKVVAVTQARVVKIENAKQFKALVDHEAAKVFGGKQVTLTLKDQIFTPWAGIDRSNIPGGYAVLWPVNPYGEAERILKHLKKHYKLNQLGVLIIDSFCLPLRKGVTGIALGYAGFRGVIDKRGQKDLYGNRLKVTQENIADSLATVANLVMGQGKEQTPFAVIKNAPVEFIQKKVPKNEMIMSPKECLYMPLYKKNMLG